MWITKEKWKSLDWTPLLHSVYILTSLITTLKFPNRSNNNCSFETEVHVMEIKDVIVDTRPKTMPMVPRITKLPSTNIWSLVNRLYFKRRWNNPGKTKAIEYEKLPTKADNNAKWGIITANARIARTITLRSTTKHMADGTFSVIFS